MILLIDNYDSFVHNLARYLRRLGQETLVIRNDAIDMTGVRCLAPQAIVISPGPCSPREAGCSEELVRHFGIDIPILGVCLGHQAIAAAFGAAIARAPEPFHGRTSIIRHDQTGVFADLPDPLTVARYHSLVVDEATLPADLQVTARTNNGLVMAIRHLERPLVGVQFHPESILADHGYKLLTNFLEIAQIPIAQSLQLDSEYSPPMTDDTKLPQSPVTF
jgi:anthranilate synthase/aminodeoxychorismate synthase-like glutamine amidotransferase